MTSRAPVLVAATLMLWAGSVLAGAAVPSGQRERVISEAFFGIHFHRLRPRPNENAIATRWPPLRFGVVRLWDSSVRWADLEPQPGVWDFTRLDHYVAEAEKRGAEVLLTLGSTPRWASSRPDEPCSYGPAGCAASPRSMADWAQYVRVVAARYRGRICCYEVWNEPDFSGPPSNPAQHAGFYSGSVGEMVEMTRIARDALSGADPDARLFSPGFVNGVENRLVPYLAAGAGRYLDGIAYHFYAWYDEARMVREMERVREALQRFDLAELPVWSTEAGVEVFETGRPIPEGHRRVSRNEGAAMMVRQIVLAAAAGLDKYIYYAWDNDRSGMVDRKGQARPAYDAMLLVQRWLLGTTLQGCELPRRRVTLCWARRDGRPMLIAWNGEDGSLSSYPLPAGLRVVSRQYAVPGWREAQAPSHGTLPQGLVHAGPNPALYQFEETSLQ